MANFLRWCTHSAWTKIGAKQSSDLLFPVTNHTKQPGFIKAKYSLYKHRRTSNLRNQINFYFLITHLITKFLSKFLM